ncbi:VCBS repeat-containing protein [Myxococcota bacterium]|nr:VCBS repeat-containing protein [Myxococcota bacterium]
MRRLKLALFSFTAASLGSVALAASPAFRFIERSQDLPASASVPATDTLDVDLVDVDGDGDRDLFVVEGTASADGRPNWLWINDGSGHFTDESAARLPPSFPANSTEVEAGDVDADGDLDLVVSNLGPEQLLVNDGSGHFTDESATRLPPPLTLFNDISAEARFADVDRDGDLDLLISNENPFNPSPLGGAQNRVWINDGSGHFTDETAARLPARTDQTAGMAVGDLDRDGDLDLVVVNIGQERVLMNDGTGHFTDETSPRFPADATSTRKGVLGDVNGDGCLDLATANSRGQQNRLYLNNCRGAFTDVTTLALPERLDTTSDVDLVDLDQDGDLDLFFTNSGAFSFGHGFAGDQLVYWENDGRGRFTDRTLVHFPNADHPSSNADFGDVDGDGDLDLAVGNSGADDGAERLYLQRP